MAWYTLAQIGATLGLEVAGNREIGFNHLAEPADAGPQDLAIALKPEFEKEICKGKAKVALLLEGADWQGLGLEGAIFSTRGRVTLAALSSIMDTGLELASGIHPSAVIDPNAVIADTVSIGPFAVIGAGAVIGENAKIAEYVSIGAGAQIGDDALIHSGVKIGANVKIGHRFICHSGAVIGADGFSFVTPEKSTVENVRGIANGVQGEIKKQIWNRIHSLGSVLIGNDVEIGANTCIDRGTIRDTSIGNRTKIDNLIQIGHNVVIGEDCLLCAHVGIAGSTRVGNRVVMGGKTGVSDNIIVGDDVVCAGGTMLGTHAHPGSVLVGMPATPMGKQTEIYHALRHLPKLLKRFSDLEKSFKKREMPIE